MNIEKSPLFDLLFTELNTSLNIAIQAASDAKELATHEQSKPETQYDTVGLEASYLAHGQSQRVNDIQLALKDWTGLQNKTFEKGASISAGALVQLIDDKQNTTAYLLGNYSGGLTLAQNENTITVITLSSPMGKKLNGLFVGDEISLPNGATDYREIVNIC